MCHVRLIGPPKGEVARGLQAEVNLLKKAFSKAHLQFNQSRVRELPRSRLCNSTSLGFLLGVLSTRYIPNLERLPR